MLDGSAVRRSILFVDGGQSAVAPGGAVVPVRQEPDSLLPLLPALAICWGIGCGGPPPRRIGADSGRMTGRDRPGSIGPDRGGVYRLNPR